MKKERRIILILCFLLLLVGLFLFFGLKDAKQCVGNPFIYGANKLTNENTMGVSCTCYFGNPRYAPFYFDNEYISAIEE